MGKIVHFMAGLIGLILSTSLSAASIVYEISKGGDKIYLAGSIHMLRSQDFPPPAEFDFAYKQSQKIYFEMDIQHSKTPAFGERFAQAMRLPDKSNLKDVLSPNVWSELQSFAKKNNFPLEQFANYNPALLSILITISESKKIGIDDGIDVYYDNLARQDGKNLGELESADDVIRYMEKFAQENPDKIIKSTLSDMETIGDDLKRMIASWKAGDLDALERSLGKRMQVDMPYAYKALVSDRNKKWMPQLEKMFKTPEVEMVLVGSLHLSGKDGLLAGLKKAGYSVKPVSETNR